MTVAELIAYLQTQPQDLPVAYEIHSEYCLLEANDIAVVTACKARKDGWIHRDRPDMEPCDYLMFP